MVRIEINKKQLIGNFVDAFFYASWIYLLLACIGGAVGAVGFVYGIGKSSSMLILGVAAVVMAGLALLIVCFHFITLYLVFFGKLNTTYPDGVKKFEIERSQAGFEIHNLVVGASATLHFHYIAKIVKTKRTILIRLKKGTIFGFPRTPELDEIFTN